MHYNDDPDNACTAAYAMHVSTHLTDAPNQMITLLLALCILQSQTVEFTCEDNFYMYQTLLMGLGYPYDFSACTDFNNGGLIITHVPLTEVSGNDTVRLIRTGCR